MRSGFCCIVSSVSRAHNNIQGIVSDQWISENKWLCLLCGLMSWMVSEIGCPWNAKVKERYKSCQPVFPLKSFHLQLLRVPAKPPDSTRQCSSSRSGKLSPCERPRFKTQTGVLGSTFGPHTALVLCRKSHVSLLDSVWLLRYTYCVSLGSYLWYLEQLYLPCNKVGMCYGKKG